MSTLADIVLADGQTTPVNHTFTAFQPQSGAQPASWQNTEAPTAAGFRKVTLSLVSPKTAGSAYKVRMVISDPVLASIPESCCADSNIPKVSYTDFFDATFSIPYSATLQNRKDILAYARAFLGLSVVTSAVQNLEPVSH